MNERYFRRDRRLAERFVYRKLLKRVHGATPEQLPVVADGAADHISGNRRKGSPPVKLRSYRQTERERERKKRKREDAVVGDDDENDDGDGDDVYAKVGV